MTTALRSFLAVLLAALLAGCVGSDSRDARPPIVFVHGNGDTAALWYPTVWRFESNGWPRERLFAVDLPYPLARGEDDKPQEGRTSAEENMRNLAAEVERVRKLTGADKVMLVGNSRGGNVIRHYIRNGGGAAAVSRAVIGGGTDRAGPRRDRRRTGRAVASDHRLPRNPRRPGQAIRRHARRAGRGARRFRHPAGQRDRAGVGRARG